MAFSTLGFYELNLIQKSKKMMKILRIFSFVALLSFCSAHVNVLQFYKHEKLPQNPNSQEFIKSDEKTGSIQSNELLTNLPAESTQYFSRSTPKYDSSPSNLTDDDEESL